MLPLLFIVLLSGQRFATMGPPARSFGQLPLAFVANPEETAQGVRMQAYDGGVTVSLLSSGVAIRLAETMGAAAPDRLDVRFEGVNPGSRVVGSEPLPGIVNLLRGSDPGRWRTNLPTYAAATYRDLYAGIDLRYDGRQGHLKGTYVVAPHGDPTRIRWRYTGLKNLDLDPASGDLKLTMSGGRTLTEYAPIAWQDIGGRRLPVAARYALVDDMLSFNLGAYDPAYPLVIDPELVYASYLGGSFADAAHGVTLDAGGNIYLTGYTVSDDFPTMDGARNSDRDVFVSKFDPTGTQLLYSTLIGGYNADDGLAIAVNASGEAVVSVTTFSDDFPVMNPLLDSRSSHNGALIKLDADGALTFSTYLNATMYEANRNVGVDQAGNIYVTGDVEDNIGVFKLSPDGQELLAAATIGGRGSDLATALAVHADGAVYLTGRTEAYRNNFPVTADALQPECTRESADVDASCSRDAFLLILDADLQTRYSSFLGGSYFDEGAGIALDRQGAIALVGTTFSADFPVRNAVQPACPDGVAQDDATECKSFESFVTKLTPDGRQIVFSTYFSSTDWSADVVKDVAVDHAGTIHLLGWTNSPRYPVKDAPQPNLTPGICLNAESERRCEDAVITAFAADGALVYSTYLGGAWEEYGYGIAADMRGGVWVSGLTTSRSFPTTDDAFQGEKGLNEDGFLAKIGGGDPVATPVDPTPVDPTPTIPRDAHKVYLPIVRR